MHNFKYEEIVQLCKGCVYFRSFESHKNARRYCCYLLDTGEPRGSPPQKCARKKTKNGDDDMRGKRTPVEIIHEITELHKQGKSCEGIAAAVGVGKTTVRRTLKKLEPAPSANGTGSKSKENLPTDIIPEIPADVNPPCDEIFDDNFCCEVTGDTDIEAYMADREKFFKERRSIPDAVLEACRERRERLMGKVSDLLDEVKHWNSEIDVLDEFVRRYVK